MKIIFLCGSLEPGRDGVGDYVRRFSNELSKQGHYASVVALNDYYIRDAVSDNQMFGNQSITVLRLPSVWKANQRFAHAKHWVDQFNPDWVSLQFVPFAFHTKGLPLFLSKQIFSFGVNRQWHIMFHELWIGMNLESSKKIQVWGRCQEFLIKSLIKKLNPKVIHTQSSLYQSQLKRLGFDSQILPLFTNIPYTDKLNSKTIKNTATAFSQNQNIYLVVFGTIHPNAPIESLVSDAALYTAKHNSTVTLTIVGRCGSEQKRWAHAWQAAGLPVHILGEQSPEIISEVLQNSSLGIATTPLAQIEKSGTVAAMLEHGLPVLCVAGPWTPRDVDAPQIPSGIFAYVEGNLEAYFNKPFSKSAHQSIFEITESFSNSLSNNLK